MKKIFSILFLILALSTQSWSATYCVTTAGAGSKNGADWSNAMAVADLVQAGDGYTSKHVRGNTYYYANGYFGYHLFGQAVSGTDRIIIKKATVADHVTETGWSATYAEQAVFVGLQTQVGYITIDGQTGTGNSEHGIKIYRPYPVNISALIANCYPGGCSNVDFSHIEITNFTSATGSDLNECWDNNTCKIAVDYSTISDITLTSIYAHDVAGGILGTGVDGLVVDDFYIAYTSSSGAFHANAIQWHYSKNITVKNSFFHDVEGTAVIANLTANGESFPIYNNIMYWSPDNPKGRSGTGHGVFSTNRLQNNVEGLKFYSNTIVNGQHLSNPAAVMFMGGCSSGCEVKNNIWYCVTGACGYATHAGNFGTVLHFQPNASSHTPDVSHVGASITCTSGSGIMGNVYDVNTGDNMAGWTITNTSGSFATDDTCTDSAGGDLTITKVATTEAITWANNYYYGNASTAGESGTQYVVSNQAPFVSYAGLDFRLADNANSALGTGATLGAPYNVDRAGTARSAPYDMGAYQGTYADIVSPTLATKTISTNGTTLTLVFSESVTVGAGGNGGWTIAPSGAAAALSYVSGSGTASLIYTISRTIMSDETATVSYTQPTNGVEDNSGNDLATLTNSAVTNSSIQSTTAGNINPGTGTEFKPGEGPGFKIE